jgi:acyl transferase domain-containing protein/thioesterase domain-containing protein
MPPYQLDETALDSPDIAVVGVAVRLPGADDVWSYWNNLKAGTESIARLSDEQLRKAGVDPARLHDPNYVKAAAPIHRLELFDRKHFGLSEREASVMDPQHRHFLEVCVEALDIAGIDPATFSRPIGVFAGSGMNAYMPYNLFTNPTLMQQQGLFLARHTGNDKDFLTTRVSYCLNLKGPSVAVQTACSTSLVAIHMACQSLLSAECDAALAGGVTIELPHHQGYHYEEGEILSPDGHCRPFEARSKGTVFGSGAGVVVLKRLRDAVAAGDTIWALVKGSAINNDGNRKVGYLAPSVEGQAECIVEALQVAGLHANDISYVECHGTGTAVGDPIEVTALTQAFRRTTKSTGFCGIGSVKSNIGHLDTAAGIASFAKVVQMLRHEEQAKTLHFEQPNPLIDFAATPFSVVAGNRPWPRSATPRRAGVSSLGVGGTNAHIILEEAPVRLAAPKRNRPPLVFSARSAASARALASKVVAAGEAEGIELGEAACTLLARAKGPHRLALAVESWSEAAQLLQSGDEKRLAVIERTEKGPRPVVFLFPGGGAQYTGMAQTLAAEYPAFKTKLEACFSILKKHQGIDLEAAVLGADSDISLEKPSLALPALLSVELAFAELVTSLGVTPVAMLGHSLGEYAAAHLAGVLSLEDALAIVCTRGRLFEKVRSGSMLAVSLEPEMLAGRLPAGVSLGVINTPTLAVASGETAGIDTLEAQLRAEEIDCTRLHIDVAAHSPLLDDILPAFAESLRGVRFSAPKRPYLNNRTGTWAADVAPTADDFVRHLREPVRFSDCLAAVVERHPDALLLELGPSQTLSSIARIHPARTKQPVVSASCHAKERGHEATHWAATVARLVAHDVGIDSKALFPERRVVPLPPTPFEHERHWVEPGPGYFMATGTSSGTRQDDRASWFFAPKFRERALSPGNSTSGERWVCFVDEGPLAKALAFEVKARGGTPVLVFPSTHFEQRPDGHFNLPMGNAEAIDQLFQKVTRAGPLPGRFIYSWSLSSAAIETTLERALWTPMALAQVLAQEDLPKVLQLCLATTRAVETDGCPVVNPLLATVRGPALVVPREVPEVSTVWVDFLDTETPDAIARALVEEAAAPDIERVVARRGTKRLVEGIDRVQLAVPTAAAAKKVLITGGLGGMGFALASSYVGSGTAVTLLGRRMPTGARATAIDTLRKQGLSVTVSTADVDDAAALAAVVAQHGPFDVVVHAAGVLDDGPLTLKSKAAATRVLRPKIQGSMALVSALENNPPAELVLISSTSAFLGPPGQIDYVAANAFVNALAGSLTARWTKTHVVALASGVWKQSGMAVRAASGIPEAQGLADTRHPWLHHRRLEENSVVYESRLSSQWWVLDQHRVRGGHAVMPGTGFVELMAAAGQGGELKDLIFSSALSVADDSARLLRVTARDGAVVVESRGPGETGFTEHARGHVSVASRMRPTALHIESVIARCRQATTQFEAGAQTLPQDRDLAFGWQWQVLRSIHVGDKEAVARLELPAAQHADAEGIALHPGLLDILTGFAFSLADGPGNQGVVRVPLSYQRVSCYEPLPRTLVSWVRLVRTAAEGIAVFDAVVAAPDGRVVMEIEGYTTKAVPPQALRGTSARREATPSGLLDDGFTDEEGAWVLRQVMEQRLGSQVVATTVSPYALLEALAPKQAPAPTAAPTTSSGADEANAPRDEVEKTLADVWRTLLGVERVSIRDNFFELGGHSLIAVRLFTRLKKAYGVDLPLSVLFEAPTIEGCAAVLRSALGITFVANAPRPSVPRPSAPPSAPGRNWSPLVSIQQGQGVPFFCVHGAGGNVLNFRALSKGLKGRPFYGLQALGTEGSQPLRRIEEMAALYLPAIQAAWPSGPYVLGGYSGGGAVALEMAQMLHAQGVEVAMVVFLDTFRPGQPPRPLSLSERLEHLLEEGAGYLQRRARAKVERHMSELSVELRYRYALAQGLTLPLELRDLHLTRAFLEASDRYQPKRYEGKVTLFRAREIQQVYRYVGPKLGWDAYIPSLEIVEVPGTHDSLVLEPNVQVLTQQLAHTLEAAVGS